MKKQNTKTRLVHPELNLSILDAGILIMFVDVLLVYVGLPYVLPLAVQLGFFFFLQVQGTILRCSCSLRIVVGPLLHV